MKTGRMFSSHPQFKARIEGSPETIFDPIAERRIIGRCLPGSEEFGGTTEVSPYSVRLGTTYLNARPAGQRPGSVTGYGLRSTSPFITPCCCHRVEPVERATCVIRDLDPTIPIPGRLKVAESLVVYAVRKENVRIFVELKRYVVAQIEATRSRPILP